MHAILKRRHPQLHLTICSTDTGVEGRKVTPAPVVVCITREGDVWNLPRYTLHVFCITCMSSRCFLQLTLCSVVLEDFFFFWPGHAIFALLRFSFSARNSCCWLQESGIHFHGIAKISFSPAEEARRPLICILHPLI